MATTFLSEMLANLQHSIPPIPESWTYTLNSSHWKLRTNLFGRTHANKVALIISHFQATLIIICFSLWIYFAKKSHNTQSLCIMQHTSMIKNLGMKSLLESCSRSRYCELGVYVIFSIYHTHRSLRARGSKNSLSISVKRQTWKSTTKVVNSKWLPGICGHTMQYTGDFIRPTCQNLHAFEHTCYKAEPLSFVPSNTT
jgi:hypothetical protein